MPKEVEIPLMPKITVHFNWDDHICMRHICVYECALVANNVSLALRAVHVVLI